MYQAMFWALGIEFLKNTAQLGEVDKAKQVNTGMSSGGGARSWRIV